MIYFDVFQSIQSNVGSKEPPNYTITL